MKAVVNHRYLFVIAIAALSALATKWQAGRVLPLIDYSYQTESAYRIAIGQLPYRDFALVVMPGTYYILAFIMRLFGTSALYQILYTMALSFIIVIATFAILQRISRDTVTNILLIVPLIFAAHAIYPYPMYDIHVTVFALLAILALIEAQMHRYTFLWFLSGILAALPTVFKQNTGIPFLVLTTLVVTATHGLRPSIIKRRDVLLYLLAAGLATITWILWFLYTGTLRQLIYHVFVFPSQTRRVGEMVVRTLTEAVAPQTLIMYAIACVGIGAFLLPKIRPMVKQFVICLVVLTILILPLWPSGIQPQNPSVSPYVGTINIIYFSTFWYVIIAVAGTVWLSTVPAFRRSSSPIIASLPFLLIPVISVALISQGVYSSTYGLYPFLIILVSGLLRSAKRVLPSVHWQFPALVFSALLTGILFLYVWSGARFIYIDWNGSIHRSTHPSLVGVGTRGPWLGELEELIQFVQHTIPPNESFVVIPGEDPIYSATLRNPHLPYFQLHMETLPVTPAVYAQNILDSRVEWIIIKTHRQNEHYWEIYDVRIALEPFVTLHTTLAGYHVFRRNDAAE